MRRVTLETSVLYDLEDDSWAPPVRRIMEHAHQNHIQIQVPAIVASERQKDGGHLDDFERFQERLTRNGLAEVKLLLPIGYADICFYDQFVWSGPELEALELKIHQILFPDVAFEAADGGPAVPEDDRRTWRNAKCDVQSLWCHIHYGGEIFVTRDRNFRKRSKKSRLEGLGAGLIATPEEAVRSLGL